MPQAILVMVGTWLRCCVVDIVDMAVDMAVVMHVMWTILCKRRLSH